MVPLPPPLAFASIYLPHQSKRLQHLNYAQQTAARAQIAGAAVLLTKLFISSPLPDCRSSARDQVGNWQRLSHSGASHFPIQPAASEDIGNQIVISQLTKQRRRFNRKCFRSRVPRNAFQICRHQLPVQSALKTRHQGLLPLEQDRTHYLTSCRRGAGDEHQCRPRPPPPPPP
jgi:hypothetical protein